jgi:hypothetical protein
VKMRIMQFLITRASKSSYHFLSLRSTCSCQPGCSQSVFVSWCQIWGQTEPTGHVTETGLTADRSSPPVSGDAEQDVAQKNSRHERRLGHVHHHGTTTHEVPLQKRHIALIQSGNIMLHPLTEYFNSQITEWHPWLLVGKWTIWTERRS